MKRNRKPWIVAAAVVVAAATVAGGFFLLGPGTSNAAASGGPPQPIPTTMAQIRQDMKTNPRLAQLGLLLLREKLMREHATAKPLTPAQRRAILAQIAQRKKELATQPGPETKPGITALSRYGTGPWPRCEFYDHNLYVSPPTGAHRIQYFVYAGNAPDVPACINHPSSTDAVSGYGGVLEVIYNDPTAAQQLARPILTSIKSPLKVISARGSIIVLQSLTGQQITFNMITRKFIS